MNVIVFCRLFLLLSPFTLTAAAPSPQINFISGDLQEIQHIAAREGKLLFVHFTASWCMPCQWMEKNTFRDTELAVYTNEHFLSLKIDIDDAVGQHYKEALGITLLPSLLIFSSQGALLDRKEESLDARELLKVLQGYNLPQNRLKDKLQKEEKILDSPTARLRVSRPALIPERMPSTDNGYIPLPPSITASVDRYSDQPYRYRPAVAAEQYESAPRSTGKFGIQVGVFNDYDNAIREVNRLSRIFDESVTLFAQKEGVLTHYRIIVGQFLSWEKANHYLNFIRRNDIDGFVRDMSE